MHDKDVHGFDGRWGEDFLVGRTTSWEGVLVLPRVPRQHCDAMTDVR